MRIIHYEWWQLISYSLSHDPESIKSGTIPLRPPTEEGMGFEPMLTVRPNYLSRVAR